MATQYSRLSFALSTAALSLNFVLGAVLPTLAHVAHDSVPNNQILSRHLIVQVPFDPQGRGKPDDTVGGGSRGGKCSQDVPTSPSITPLIPASSQGLTVAERPTFFVYLPQTSARKAFFSLKDEKENYYYQATLPLPKTPGIISFKLPSDAPALESGKDYQWSFVIICGEKLAVDDPRVEGQIQRVEINLAPKSQIANSLRPEGANGANDFWYDNVAKIAELRRSQPANSTLISTWETLLKSAGLERIATQPLVK